MWFGSIAKLARCADEQLQGLSCPVIVEGPFENNLPEWCRLGGANEGLLRFDGMHCECNPKLGAEMSVDTWWFLRRQHLVGGGGSLERDSLRTL